jgi:hypothetical protein
MRLGFLPPQTTKDRFQAARIKDTQCSGTPDKSGERRDFASSFFLQTAGLTQLPHFADRFYPNIAHLWRKIV